jgi:hypothetical protein
MFTLIDKVTYVRSAFISVNRFHTRMTEDRLQSVMQMARKEAQRETGTKNTRM